MSKFKVGDEMWIHTKICITAIQEGKSGQIIYATDKEIHIREAILDQIRSASVAPVATQPAPRFKVGDRVVTMFGNGTVVEIRWLSAMHAYTVEHDIANDMCHSGEWEGSGKTGKSFACDRCWFFKEEDLSPAPEPKYYSGKVFAVRMHEGSFSDTMRKRIGHVFEIKGGSFVKDYCEFGLPGTITLPKFKSFHEFSEYFFATEWQEVKE